MRTTDLGGFLRNAFPPEGFHESRFCVASVALNSQAKAMGVMTFHVLGTPFARASGSSHPALHRVKTKLEIWELRNGILIVSWPHHVALGKSAYFSESCVCKTGVVTLAHRCCQHYLIN